MIPAIQELNFPKIEGKQYATLTHATVTLADMGEKTISTQVKIDGGIVPDFSQDWEVVFQGEKYIMPLRLPQGAKENTSLNSTIDLTFQHWAIWQLKRWPFVTMQPIDTGTAVADEEVASVQLNLKEFCDLFGQVLRYYYGDTIAIDLNPAWKYDNAPTAIEINHSFIWDVLIDAFHGKYGVRWAIEPREDNDNTVKGGERYVIKIGYPTTEVDHIFEYGFEGGLLKLERQVQSEDIRNMIKGRGGEKNIPFRYFKDVDPNNPDFRADPDWVEELKNIYFTNLMPATYRSYIQGWKAAHISKYPGYTPVGENNAYAPWAYRKGYTDKKFHPVEFVADEITINPETEDRQIEVLPDYSPFVKKGSSLDTYGPLQATLDNNEDAYPTIQGTGMDIAVDVAQVESDDVEESIENESKLQNVESLTSTHIALPNQRGTISITFPTFTVPQGQHANILQGAYTKNAYIKTIIGGFEQNITDLIVIEDTSISVFNAVTGEQHSAVGIPSGTWYWIAKFKIHVTWDNSQGFNYPYTCITVGYESVKIEFSNIREQWRNTFDIWVKNIWDTTKLSSETNEQYAERVWKRVFGDREKNEAAVMFTTGALAHEDYEFKIPKGAWPIYDTSKSYTDANGVRHDSHWRIKLAKSDAELEATGLYVPSTQKQGKAGDTFAFIGTEMTHVPYIVDAEIRLDDWKKDHLGEVKEIKPTFVVTTDRVRLNNEGKPDALINQLRVGNSLRIADKRFIQPMDDRAYETLYLQSLTYTYREPSSDDAALNPDVEIVLSNEYTTSANPVSVMQGEISSMQRLLGSISNVEQIVRAVGDKLYLRKDGISDRSLSPTQFLSLLTSGDFRAGVVGGAGWGFFKDENGNWVLEADRVNVRQEFQVNTLVINQAEGRGGMEIDTAAFIEVTRVIDTPQGYVCYFDQKRGSVANLFHVDDVAYCNRWTAENTELKFYKRRVIAIAPDSITLSKKDVNGTGIPAEKDNIIHFGNYTDKTRQYVKVRDVVGGGYERFLDNLNSVNTTGTEYYFVGRQEGMYNNRPRWYIGDKNGYIEWVNGELNVNAKLTVGSKIGDKTIGDFVDDVAQKKADKLQREIDNIKKEASSIKDVLEQMTNDAIFDVIEKQQIRIQWETINGAASVDATGRSGSYYHALQRADAADGRTGFATADRAIFLVRTAPQSEQYAQLLLSSGAASVDLLTTTYLALRNYLAAVRLYDDEVTEGFDPHRLAELFTAYYDALDAVYKGFSDKAQRTADEALTEAAAAKERLDEWASDNVISPTEKTALRQQEADIRAEHSTIVAQAAAYGIDARNYNQQYDLTIAALAKYTASIPENIPIEDDYDDIRYYYDARIAILENIDAAQKAESDKAARNYRNEEIDPPTDMKVGDTWTPTNADGEVLGYTMTYVDQIDGRYKWVITGDNTKTVIKNGLITTGTVLLGDESDPAKAKAGATGAGTTDDSVRFWAGSERDSMDTAPFRVTQKGKLYSSDSDIAGKITARTGSIGGLEIADRRIGVESFGNPNDDTSSGLSIYNDFVKMSNSKVWVGFGTNVAPAVFGAPIPAIIRNEASLDDKAYGLQLDVRGAMADNIALDIPHGAIHGVRHNVRILSKAYWAYELTDSDYEAIVNDADITVRLPAKPQKGQVFRIWKHATGNATIQSLGPTIRTLGSNSSGTTYSIPYDNHNIFELIYTGSEYLLKQYS